MSFWKKLFGGSSEKTSEQAKDAGQIEHKSFIVTAVPFVEGGQYQVCGVISKEIDGEVKEYRFIRADRCPSIDDAATITFNKGRQIIDEQGDRMFEQ